MRNLLKEVSETSIHLGDFTFTKQQVDAKWLGDAPASEKEISDAERRLKLVLPHDYKEFLRVCNGFHAPNDVEPSFLSLNKIDYLQVLDPEIVNIWMEPGSVHVGIDLKKSIIIGGVEEEQYFLLIPPGDDSGWRYWKFASWMLGQQEYKDLASYWNDVLEFNKEQLNTR